MVDKTIGEKRTLFHSLGKSRTGPKTTLRLLRLLVEWNLTGGITK